MTSIRTNKIMGAAACAVCVAAVAVLAGLPAGARSKGPVPLKEAKLNIEHNATDHDTGFQGGIDSEGWQYLDIAGPGGVQLHLEGKGKLAELGVTELFFETVEPTNADVPLGEMLQNLPAGQYTISGRAMIDGESSGETAGTAWLTHTIPAGPELQWPAKGGTVPVDDLVIRWGAVTRTLQGGPVKIIGYQLIVEKDTQVHPHMIGKWGLSLYLSPSITSMAIPRGFLEPNTPYKWEVLAIEESGNQTLSSSEFRTQ